MLMNKLKWMLVYINIWRIMPVYWFTKMCYHKDKINKDIEVWIQKLVPSEYQTKSRILKMGYCIFAERAFVNVIQNRLHRNPVMWGISRILFKPLDSLYINMPPEDIGGGLYFQHGFATVVAAKKIGSYCHINQQVTIGYAGCDAPIIEDNVVVAAGAIVIGKVHVGSDSVIGAGSVVIRDVPAESIVAGVPARVLRGKINEENRDTDISLGR